jgi:hypothetical protein
MLGFSGIDLGIRYGAYHVIPTDPYTGSSLLAPGSHESPASAIQKVTMYSVSFQLYGSVVGHRLLKNRDRKLVIADISELGLDLGRASESGKQFDGTDIHSLTGKPGPNNTLGSFVNIGVGLLAAYRISDNMRVSLRYQYLIDQGVIFYSWLGLDDTHNFDLSRKRLSATWSFKQYMFESNIGIGWNYRGSTHGNHSFGFGIRSKIKNSNKHFGLKMNIVNQRKSPQSGTRNWYDVMVYYGVGG